MHLHFEHYGAGSPLIILHGLFGSLENWRTLSKTFAQFFHVFALDQRNHGRSPHSDEFNYQVMAADVLEFMQAQGFASAHLLGHSMGGKTAMLFAVTYPEMINRLVVVDIAPKAYPPDHDEIFEALLALDVQALRTRQEADAALAVKLPDLALRQFLLKNLERNTPSSFHWKMNLDALYTNYTAILKGLDPNCQYVNPTLFIKGEHSGYIREADTQTITAIFPQAQFVTIPGAGHWVHAEAPQEFARVVLDFLA